MVPISADRSSRLFDVVVAVVFVVAAAGVVGHDDRDDAEVGDGGGGCFLFGSRRRNFSSPLKSFPIFGPARLPDHIRRQGQT